MTDRELAYLHNDPLEESRSIPTSTLETIVKTASECIGVQRVAGIEVPPEMSSDAMELIGNRCVALFGQSDSDDRPRSVGLTAMTLLALAQGAEDTAEAAVVALSRAPSSRSRRDALRLNKVLDKMSDIVGDGTNEARKRKAQRFISKKLVRFFGPDASKLRDRSIWQGHQRIVTH